MQLEMVIHGPYPLWNLEPIVFANDSDSFKPRRWIPDEQNEPNGDREDCVDCSECVEEGE